MSIHDSTPTSPTECVIYLVAEDVTSNCFTPSPAIEETQPTSAVARLSPRHTSPRTQTFYENVALGIYKGQSSDGPAEGECNWWIYLAINYAAELDVSTLQP
jgi:hypothetical protein